MRKFHVLVPALAVAGLILAAPAAAAQEPEPGEAVYVAALGELNDSGASGTATVTVAADGTTMTVRVVASGFNLDGPHAMHLHGLVSGDEVLASLCPTMADDADGDGVLDVAEGLPKYGAEQISLTTEGDTSRASGLAIDRYQAGTSIDYERSGIEIPENLQGQIGRMHLVVHGIDENGNGVLDLDQEVRSTMSADLPREGTAPALCGEFMAQPTGPIQTGAGGTAATDGGMTVGAAVAGAAAGAVALGGVGLVVARRRGAEA